jgi:FdhD protein
VNDDPRWVPAARTEVVGTHPREGLDDLAREEPLEIRLAGVTIAVVMRTPGHDEELVRGFLLTEGIVARPEDIAAVRPCDVVTEPDAEDNVILATLRPELEVDLTRFRRNTFASSSCGVCGKASLASAMATAGPVADGVRFALEVVRRLPAALRGAQEVFSRTGALHAAALCRPDGDLLVVREDVGRHNAVDKVVGWAAAAGCWPCAGLALIVSGRVSFEVVQKAVAGRIPVVAAISAPTSLAVELARAAGVTLVGFLREDRLCVYAAAERLTGTTPESGA